MIFNMKRYKRMGLREIAWELNDKGIFTASGDMWQSRIYKYMLENPPYKSIAYYKDNKVKNKELVFV